MNRLLQASFAALTLLSSAAYAHSGGEARTDVREVRQDRRELRDDQRDRAQAATLLSRYDGALARRDLRAVSWLDREALRMMDQEVTEGWREVRADKAEVARSAHEVRDSREELDRTRRPDARADDRRDLRDDRRDLRDDVRDVRVEQRDLRHVRALRDDFAALQGRMNRRSLERKRALLADFLQRSHRELAQNAAERREDRREVREDRRERREDWTQVQR